MAKLIHSTQSICTIHLIFDVSLKGKTCCKSNTNSILYSTNNNQKVSVKAKNKPNSIFFCKEQTKNSVLFTTRNNSLIFCYNLQFIWETTKCRLFIQHLISASPGLKPISIDSLTWNKDRKYFLKGTVYSYVSFIVK